MELIDEILRQAAELPRPAALLVIALATFASEDLACIGAGLAAAAGALPPAEALGAAALGIWLGDLGLYALGRGLGRQALARAPLKWWCDEARVEAAEAWFQRRGALLLWVVRFVPGTRLPTYLAAGLLRAPFASFALATALAVAVWTPILGGGALLLGREILPWIERWRELGLVLALSAIVLMWLVARILLPLATWRGRRLLLGRWRRLSRWEYWPAWTIYPPVVLLWLWKSLCHRSASSFTAVNPGMEAGGFVNESKSSILRALGDQPEVARHVFLPAGRSVEERWSACRAFLEREGLDFPLVLKPDAGQRGHGVAVVRDESQARAWLARAKVDALAQEHAVGEEYGVFWWKHPQAERGCVWSITRKVFPVLVGDGVRTLEELILDDERAVCMAEHYIAVDAHRGAWTPASGERVQLVEVGSHCRGAIFLDGAHLATDELRAAIERISAPFAGFHYGRYDLRARSDEHLRRGEGLKIIELNGATSEATHIYDPRHGVVVAWTTLWRQWSILYDIAEANLARGARPARFSDLARAMSDFRRAAKGLD